MLRVTVLTHIVTPYQVEFFDAIRRHGIVDIRVIYLEEAGAHRRWRPGNIDHPFISLAEAGPEGSKEASDWISRADLVVFGQYRHTEALRWIHQRNAAKYPWCFWGERPGFRFGGLAGRIYRAWKLKALRVSRAPIWGIGQWAIDGYRKEFGGERRYFNIPYFSDLERFVTSRSQPNAGVRRFLFSGSLIKRKGIDLLAQAFRELARSNDRVALDIVGGGELLPWLEKELAPVREKVTFHGFKQWEELPAFYHRADILCVPSRYDGWGLVVPEGLASGLPVITSDKMGAGIDLVRDGVNGWVVKAGDLASLDEALKKAASLAPHELTAMASVAAQSTSGHRLDDGVRRFEEAVSGSMAAWGKA